MEDLLFRLRIESEMDVHLAVYKAGQELQSMKDEGGIKLAKIKTTISELGYNIIKYAKTGNISLMRVSEPRKGIKVLAVDQGPGIPDVELALKDHYSSGGTLGLGLPGVKRLMDTLEIKSKIGEGTTVSAILYL